MWPDLRVALRKMGFTREHLWEVDHIKPVSEGGGLCGLDNLRTLCTPCHDAETRRLRMRLAGKCDDPAPSEAPLFEEEG